jgi:pullulanase/glycogen debranching enzyme
MIEKIRISMALGVTAVELLPVCEFDDSDMAQSRGRDDSKLLGLQHGRILQPSFQVNRNGGEYT